MIVAYKFRTVTKILRPVRYSRATTKSDAIVRRVAYYTVDIVRQNNSTLAGTSVCASKSESEKNPSHQGRKQQFP